MAAPTEQRFAGESASPAAARGFATSVLNELLPAPIARTLCDDIELVVSELVTNAVRAGSPAIHVAVAHENNRIVVRVRDEAPGWPEQRDAGVSDPTGRGLALVSAICAAWGVRLAANGKIVWAELAVPGPG